jgi:hypothetical protein
VSTVASSPDSTAPMNAAQGPSRPPPPGIRPTMRWQVTIGAYRTTPTATTYFLRNHLQPSKTSCMGVNHLRSLGVLYVRAVLSRPGPARRYARLGTDIT